MMPRLPDIVIEGDSPSRLMARTPELVGLSRRRVVWRFGFQPGRALAVATGLWTPEPVWVLAVYRGTVILVYRGDWTDQPPAQIMNVLSAPLEHDRRDFSSLHPRPRGVPASSGRRDLTARARSTSRISTASATTTPGGRRAPESYSSRSRLTPGSRATKIFPYRPRRT
jgi:hypothetical protein